MTPLTATPTAQRARSGPGLLRRIGVPVALLVALGSVLVASAAIGSVPLPLQEVLDALAGARELDAHLIVQDSRLPRTASGIVAGVCLAVSGVLLQGATRNPLASPTLLGITSGAGFAVVLTVAVLGMPSGFAVWAAFAGGAGAAGLALALASSGRDGMSPLRLALSGAVISLLLSAWTRGILALNESHSDQVRHWLAGSLAGRDAADVPPLLPAVAVCLVAAVALARPLDALALGDEAAVGLGQRPARVRTLTSVVAVALAAIAVAVAGPIAFLGLMVPHLARFLVGGRHLEVLLTSALMGPVVLLAADIVGRVIARPTEVQAGVLTALIGAPVLVWVATRARIAR
ncbi:FecCD family ABC transporter permease [Ruania alba]|uniref:Iron complex transport system permease protein n=1 Tax=Ruania alba TaxID=648782 RepID=A0A1H5MB01_9MICO|nr:iron ABC transporter permease [Ruania alba]SEE86484.1 iron complex transport system permease protein [Ruania alba]